VIQWTGYSGIEPGTLRDLTGPHVVHRGDDSVAWLAARVAQLRTEGFDRPAFNQTHQDRLVLHRLPCVFVTVDEPGTLEVCATHRIWQPARFVSEDGGPLLGYVVSRTGGRLAESEWKAGFRVGEGEVDPVDLIVDDNGE
jgi:hypothetical protein